MTKKLTSLVKEAKVISYDNFKKMIKKASEAKDNTTFSDFTLTKVGDYQFLRVARPWQADRLFKFEEPDDFLDEINSHFLEVVPSEWFVEPYKIDFSGVNIIYQKFRIDNANKICPIRSVTFVTGVDCNGEVKAKENQRK